MTSNNRHSSLLRFVAVVLVGIAGSILLVVIAAGCSSKKPSNAHVKLTSKYDSLPPRQVPEYLKGTVLERCDLYNNAPFPVSGFGLVANLRGTGDTFAGTPVRNYILTTMIKRGFGS